MAASIIEDFEAIAMRLNEIAEAKQPKPETKPVDEQAVWDAVYGFTDIGDVYCG